MSLQTNTQVIINLYQEGNSLTTIAKMYKTYHQAIKKILVDNGIEIRNKSESRRQDHFNEAFFSLGISTHEQAYLFGLLLADGYLHEKSGSVKIDLKHTDFELLQQVAKLINSSAEVRIYEQITNYGPSKMARWKVVSKQFSSDLVKLGCHQNKSSTLVFPNIPKQVLNSFLLGYFDGDGCFSFSKTSTKFGITGTKEFCETTKTLLTSILGIGGGVYKETNSTAYTYQVGGKHQLNILLPWLYMDSTIFLQRKYEKCKSYINVSHIKKSLL